MKNRFVTFGIILLVVLMLGGGFLLSRKKYTAEDFGIATFVSEKDKDLDGVNDQTDILESAKHYLAQHPKYKSQYYDGGYPDDGYGVCTDVVAFALMGAGYDLQELVDADIRENPEQYEIAAVDKNIDFRRVKNLKIFFENNVESLTTDVREITEWQGGDIVVFENHIGIVSDARNFRGIPFVLHHESPWQFDYEENILERRKIVGHYRMSAKQLFVDYHAQAEEIVKEMSLEEKVSAMFLVRFLDGKELERVAAAGPSGFILFAKDFQNETKSSLTAKLKKLQAESKIEFIFGVDEEGGAVTRVSRFPAFRPERFMSPQDLYSRGGINLVVSDAHEKSELLASLGINMNLAPVADVTTTKNAFIYARSLGRDATETASYVGAVVRVMREDNMISVMKHFPGYGDNVDTHTDVAIDQREYEDLAKNDFLPFVAGIRAGGPAILVNHNIVEAIDGSMPASLSAPVHKILRDQLDFTGVIMTDDLAMSAVQEYVTNGEAAVQAVLAGNDLIITSDFWKQRQEILEAVESGKISETQIDMAVRRVIAMKMAYGVFRVRD